MKKISAIFMIVLGIPAGLYCILSAEAYASVVPKQVTPASRVAPVAGSTLPAASQAAPVPQQSVSVSAQQLPAVKPKVAIPAKRYLENVLKNFKRKDIILLRNTSLTMLRNNQSILRSHGTIQKAFVQKRPLTANKMVGFVRDVVIDRANRQITVLGRGASIDKMGHMTMGNFVVDFGPSAGADPETGSLWIGFDKNGKQENCFVSQSSGDITYGTPGCSDNLNWKSASSPMSKETAVGIIEKTKGAGGTEGGDDFVAPAEVGAAGSDPADTNEIVLDPVEVTLDDSGGSQDGGGGGGGGGGGDGGDISGPGTKDSAPVPEGSDETSDTYGDGSGGTDGSDGGSGSEGEGEGEGGSDCLGADCAGFIVEGDFGSGGGKAGQEGAMRKSEMWLIYTQDLDGRGKVTLIGTEGTGPITPLTKTSMLGLLTDDSGLPGGGFDPTGPVSNLKRYNLNMWRCSGAQAGGQNVFGKSVGGTKVGSAAAAFGGFEGGIKVCPGGDPLPTIQ